MRPLSRTGAYCPPIESEPVRTALRAHCKWVRQRAEEACTEAGHAQERAARALERARAISGREEGNSRHHPVR